MTHAGSATPVPGSAAADEPTGPPPLPAPDLRDPLVRAERQLLQVCLQHPDSIAPADLDNLPVEGLRAPAHRAVLHGIRTAGGLSGAASLSASAWTASVADHTPPPARPLVHQLAVAALPVTLELGRPPQRYVASLLVRVVEADLNRRIDDALSALQRAQDGPDSRRLNEELTALHRQRQALRARTE